MLFDLFTVGAQTLNFLVLVWLMKRYLYKPILDAIDAREKRIAVALADAAMKQSAAQKEREAFARKNEDFECQRNELLNQAKEQAKSERQRLLNEARQLAVTLRVKREAAVTSELRSLQHDIARRSRQEVFEIAQKVLFELAGTTLEERMVEVFTCHLRVLDDGAKADLARALATAGKSLLVRSAFEMAPSQRDNIQQALDDALGSRTQIHFDTLPEMICGIELTANGWRLAWNIADSLASLEKSIDELIKSRTSPPVKATRPELAK